MVAKNNTYEEPFPFLKGGGELGELTRTFDWSATPVGAPDHWPQSLRTTVAMILSSKFPMFLWWGPDLIQFYNDAYRPSFGNAGKHPLALGQKGEECWQEIWAVISPLINQVMTTGEATWSEDQLIPIYRNGKIEDVYWTFGYSPIRGESQNIEGVLVVCTETTEKINTLRILEGHKDELEFAIDATELGTWDLNPATNKFRGNSRLKSWFGLNPEEEIELPLAIAVIAEKDRQHVMDAIANALQFWSGGMYDVEYTITADPTKRERVVRAKGRAWFNEDKIAYRFNGTLQDITEQAAAVQKIEQAVRERTEELGESNKKLQKSNADLAQFAYIASHDLQEPLRKISTFGQMLANTLKDADQASKNYIGKINLASERMRTLIRDVLNYSQLSKSSDVFKPVDLNLIVADIITDFELLIAEKDAAIQIADLPTIDAVPTQMFQLFGNLISNALKFSRPGIKPVIEITASFLDSGDYEKFGSLDPALLFYHIKLKDNGIGFDDAYAEQIFAIFQRLHGKSEYAGTGIGLAMCKKIALNHQGNIIASKGEDFGASFQVILPVKQGQK